MQTCNEILRNDTVRNFTAVNNHFSIDQSLSWHQINSKISVNYCNILYNIDLAADDSRDPIFLHRAESTRQNQANPVRLIALRRVTLRRVTTGLLTIHHDVHQNFERNISTLKNLSRSTAIFWTPSKNL